RIDDDHLAPPQAQDFPDDGADVVHINLLYDPARLDLLFKSIKQGIKFIGRFTNEQRQFRQKCQLVSSIHLTSSIVSEARELIGEANAGATNHSPSLHRFTQ